MDTTEGPVPPPAPPPTHSLRVTFAYRGNDVHIVGSDRVAMIGPPAVGAAPRDGQTGYWLQIADASGRVLWHRALSNPVAIDVEAFPGEPGRSITRVPVATIEGRFTAIVPDVPGGADLSLHGPPDARTPDAPARGLLQVPLDALRKFVPPRSPGTPGADAPGDHR